MSRKQKRNLIPKRKIKSIKKIKGGANSTQKQELKKKGATIRNAIIYKQYNILYNLFFREYNWGLGFFWREQQEGCDLNRIDWRNPQLNINNDFFYTSDMSINSIELQKAYIFWEQHLKTNDKEFEQYIKKPLSELYKELSTLLPLECTALNTSCDRAPDCSPGSIP